MQKLGLRIKVSQDDEMNMMRKWLADHGAAVPGPHSHHEPGGFMPGMLTPEEMTQLANAKGVEFDRLFLHGHDQASRRRDHDGRRLVQDARRRSRGRDFRVRVRCERGSAHGDRSDGRDAQGDHEYESCGLRIADCKIAQRRQAIAGFTAVAIALESAQQKPC
jgi:hypothetical protein